MNRQGHVKTLPSPILRIQSVKIVTATLSTVLKMPVKRIFSVSVKNQLMLLSETDVANKYGYFSNNFKQYTYTMYV